MKCPHCQVNNFEGAAFCAESGRSLRVKIRYPKCRNSSLPDKKFHNKCDHSPYEQSTIILTIPSPQLTSIAGGHHEVKNFPDEGDPSVKL